LLSLIVFGPKKLPEIGKSLGRSINEFKKSMNTEEAKAPAEPSKGEATVTTAGAADSNEEK
jgi:sec-independent protein translocase protein TatA